MRDCFLQDSTQARLGHHEAYYIFKKKKAVISCIISQTLCFKFLQVLCDGQFSLYFWVL